uniref:Cnd1 domain-containing protein n=1 Tax=Syphacia muris TaxID=451379 RepID=A0A0N5AXU4_9BILA
MTAAEKDEFIGQLTEFESIFNEIDDQWISLCQETNYTEYEHFAVQVQLSILSNPGLSQQLEELCGSILRYEQKAGTNEEIWTELAQQKMKVEKFVIFLWSLIERALSGKVDIQERIMGLLAASTYIAICSLNSSQAYCIFNQFLFQRSIEVLQLVYRLLTLSGFCGTLSQGANKGNKQKGGRKRRHRKDSVQEELGTELTITETLTSNEEAELKELALGALDSLFGITLQIRLVSLAGCRETGICTANLLKNLMTIDLCDKTEVDECKRRSDFQRKSKFSDRCFALMHRLVASRHSGAELVFSRIILPRLLFWTFENTVLPLQTHPTKVMELSKSLMLQFLEIRLKASTKDYECLEATLTLIENICYRCPDRSDYRLRVAGCVCQAVQLLPDCYRHKFVKFLVVLGTTSKVSCRNFSVEVTPLIIRLFGVNNLGLSVNFESEHNELQGEDKIAITMSTSQNSCSTIATQKSEQQEIESVDRRNSVEEKKKSSFKPVEELFFVLISSCFDKAPTVRSRAIVQLSGFFDDEMLRSALPSLFLKTVDQECVQYESKDKCMHNESEDPAYQLLQMLLLRSQDLKASVRKAALVALELLFPYLTSIADVRLALDCFQKRCRDESLLIRRQSVESLSKIVCTPHSFASNVIDRCWLQSVFPLTVDREQNVAKRATELIVDILIKPLLSEDSKIAWRILSIVEKEVNYRRLLLRAIVYQAKENMLSDKIVEMLLKMSKQENRVNIIWMLLNDLSLVFKVDPTLACEFWFSIPEEDPSNLTIYVSRILARSCSRLKADVCQNLLEDMERKIFDFRFPVSYIPSVYYAFAMLYNGVGEEASGVKTFRKVCEKLGTRCYQIMMDILYFSEMSQPSQCLSQDVSSRQLLRIICTMGEIVQYVPTMKVDKWFDELRLMMASDVIQHQLTNDGFQLPTPLSSRPPTRTANTQSTNDAPVNSQQTNSYVLQSGPTFLGKSVANISVLTREVRAQAVVIIGKLCLLNVKLAKACIPIFAKQVHTNKDHLVRNNIVIVVCDLCVRYTFLVDRYSEILASCLNDESTLVRKQTLVLLTNLIKEAYIRWEGQIMYRFVSTLLDSVEEIRSYAEMCLVDVLLVQFPSMISNHFIECLFYFNSVAHRSWTTKDGEEADISQLTKSALRGSKNKDKRMKLYKFMVKTFDDEAKLEIMKRISNEVFFATAEGVLNITERNVCLLLEDCYDIMCLKELKLSMSLGSSDDGDGDENDYPAEVVVSIYAVFRNAEVKKVFAKAFRITIIDNILPGIISLKYFLQDKMNGTLTRGVTQVLRELSRDHREQLDEFLASDERLKAEIEYDLRKLEVSIAFMFLEQEEKEKQRALQEERSRLMKQKSARQSIMLNKRRSEAVRRSGILSEIINAMVENEEVTVWAVDAKPAVAEGTADVLLCREKDFDEDSADKTLTAQGGSTSDQNKVVECAKESGILSKDLRSSVVPVESASLFPNCTSDTSSIKQRTEKINSSKRTMSPVFEPPVQKKHSKTLSTPLVMDGTDVIEARAISTPLHAINEVSFFNNGLSAILPSAKRKRPSKRHCEESFS